MLQQRGIALDASTGAAYLLSKIRCQTLCPRASVCHQRGLEQGGRGDTSAAGKHEKAAVICLGGAVKFRLESITMKTGLWRGCSACRKNAETPAFQFDCKSQGQKGSFKGRLTMGHELLKHQWPGTAKRDCKTCFYPGGTRVSCRLNRASI